MSAIVFDTLKLSKALQGEFTPSQAERLAVALVDSSFDTIATKADISDLRSELKVEMADLRVEMADLRGEMAKSFSLLRADLVRWVVTAIAFNFVAVAGLVITLVKVFGK